MKRAGLGFLVGLLVGITISVVLAQTEPTDIVIPAGVYQNANGYRINNPV